MECGTLIFVAIDNQFAYLVIADQWKPDAISATELKAEGVKQTVMLTEKTNKLQKLLQKKLVLTKFMQNFTSYGKWISFRRVVTASSPKKQSLPLLVTA